MKRLWVFLFVTMILMAATATGNAAGSRFFYSGTGAIAITAFPFTAGTSSVGQDAASFEIRLHLSAAGGAGDLTVKIDSTANSKYDALLETYDMTAVTDYVRSFDNWVSSGDAIVITWANASSRTWGLELIWKD